MSRPRLPRNDRRTYTLLVIGNVCKRDPSAWSDAEDAARYGCDVIAPKYFTDGTVEVVVLDIMTNTAAINRQVTLNGVYEGGLD